MTASDMKKLERIIISVEVLQHKTKDDHLKDRLSTAKSELLRALRQS